MAVPNDVADLTSLGFVEAGHWRLSDRHATGLTCELSCCSDDRVVYAVVSGNDVKYVGICEADTRTLKKRMNSYRSSRATKSKTSTNRRVREGIREILAGGSEVKVFALDPSTREPTPITYKGIEVDLVKGLENPLTRRFNPEWNRRSPRVLDEHKERREARRVNDRLQHKIFRAANRGDRQKLLDLGLNEDLAKAWLDKVSEVKAKTRDSRERA